MVTAYGYQRTAFGASISRGAADAFYSLGTFMVLVQVMCLSFPLCFAITRASIAMPMTDRFDINYRSALSSLRIRC